MVLILEVGKILKGERPRQSPCMFSVAILEYNGSLVNFWLLVIVDIETLN